MLAGSHSHPNVYLSVFIIRLSYACIILVYVYAIYEHPSLNFDIEFLKPFLFMPRFHHCTTE